MNLAAAKAERALAAGILGSGRRVDDAEEDKKWLDLVGNGGHIDLVDKQRGLQQKRLVVSDSIICFACVCCFIIIVIVFRSQYLYRSSVHKHVETLASHAQTWCCTLAGRAKSVYLQGFATQQADEELHGACSTARSCRGVIGGPGPGEGLDRVPGPVGTSRSRPRSRC